jgi:hypothetical protein
MPLLPSPCDPTAQYVALLMSGTPPPPAFVRLDLSTPETNRDGRHPGARSTRMSWNFFTRIASEIEQAGPEELVLANLRDAGRCTWIGEAVRFAKECCAFPHVVLQTDVLSTTSAQVVAAIDAGVDCVILSFNLACRSWRERAAACLADDPDCLRRILAEALLAREAKQRAGGRRCLVHVSQLGGRRRGDTVVGQAVADLALLADHDYVEWLPEAQDLVGAAWHRPVGGAPARRCHCWTPFTEAHVTADGFLSACRHDYFGSAHVANLNTTAFWDAWHSPCFQKTRIGLINGELEGSLCSSCPIRGSYS